MVFSDNSKLILPNLAMDLLSPNPPKLFFGGSAVRASAIVSAIGHVDLIDQSPSVHLASPEFFPKKKGGPTNYTEENATGQNGIGGGEPPVPPAPILSGARTAKSGENEGAKTHDFAAPPVKDVQAGSLAVANGNAAIASPSVISLPVSPKKNSEVLYYDVPVIANMYQIVDTSPNKGNVVGITQIKGGSGTSPADADSSFASQSKAETITGGASADEIWADNPDYSSGGRAGRIISFTPSVVDGIRVNSMTMSGMPSGFTLIGPTPTGTDSSGNSIYQIDPVSATSNEFQFKLAYTLPLPSDAPNMEGDYSKFLLKLTFLGTQSSTLAKATITSEAYIAISDVTNDSQQITINASDSRPVVHLSLHPAGNLINAGGGDDSIHAAAGADTINGGSGLNWIEYDLSGAGVSVDLKAGQGDQGFAYGDRYTNIQNILGSIYSDTLVGDDGANSISGNGGQDSIYGGGGNDYFKSDGSGLTIDGGEGFDAIDYSLSKTAITLDIGAGTVAGDSGNVHDVISNIEKVIGSDYGDTLLITGNNPISVDAGAGNDTVIAGPAADTLDGGTGINTLSYQNSATGVSVNLETNMADGGDATGDVIANFSNLNGSQGNDTLIGNASGNVIFGGKGDDSIVGGGGDDTLLGGAGNDIIVAGNGTESIDGGTGVDTVDYSLTTASLRLTLKDKGIGIALLDGGIENNYVVNIENVIGTTRDDTITGNSSDNSIAGGAGNDSLSGGLGNDTLDGGTGNNTVTYDSLEAASTPHTLQLAGTLAQTVTIGNGQIDVIQNLENLVGSRGNDLIIGDERTNSIYGGDGNDTIIGGGGRDYLDGGNGNNTVDYALKIVNGVISENSSSVTVNLAYDAGSARGVGGIAAGDTYLNIENIIGSSGSDSLVGDASDNLLQGGAGNDTLKGGGGNDTLDGGAGNDSLIAGDGQVLLIGGSGYDTLVAGNGGNTLDGSSGSGDSLVSGAGDDLLLGGAGNDTFSAGLGNNTIDGNGGTGDRVDYLYQTDPTQSSSITLSNETVWLASGTATSSDTLINIEAVKLGAGSNIVSLGGLQSINATIDGSLGALDSIATGAGNDLLTGGAGNDSLSAGYGSNTVDGRGGTLDTIDYSFLNAEGGKVAITATGSTAFLAAGVDFHLELSRFSE